MFSTQSNSENVISILQFITTTLQCSDNKIYVFLQCHYAMCGPPKYLSTGDEKEYTCCASIGYAMTRKEVLALVQGVLDSRGIPKSVTNRRWESFCHRHPYLTLRTTVPLSLS